MLTADPRRDTDASLIEEVVEIDQQLERLAGGPGSAVGSGGMASKLAAAKIATWSGVQTVIADAARPGVVRDALADEPGVGTVFRARESRLSARKLWIAFALGSSGRLTVDDGAQSALMGRGRSLLAAGVTGVAGTFRPEDAVEIAGHRRRDLRQGPGPGGRGSGPPSGWAVAARSSSIVTISSLYPEGMTPPALQQLAGRVRSAARLVAKAPSSVRDDALRLAADLLEEEWETLVEANRTDLERAEAAGMVEAARDRLRLTEERVRGMAAGLRKVAALPDPVGEVTEGWVRPNGLRVSRVRVPLGVVGVIYENRPNVTSDAAGLCLKAGNAAFLRGSSSAIESNRAVVALLRRAAVKAGLPEDSVTLVEDTSHETATAFMQLRGFIDCLIPRGGQALIASLIEHATVPYVLDGDGNCHIYIDGAADLGMAHELAINAKTHRFGVCNAVETILVHSGVAAEFLPRLADSLASAGVEIRGRRAGAGPGAHCRAGAGERLLH